MCPSHGIPSLDFRRIFGYIYETICSRTLMKYYIKTFGCQMNVSDSERIASVLEKSGLKPASNINEADFVVFNTCGVRQMAEDRVYGQIHNLKTKNKKLKTKVILTGCLANRKDVQKRLHGKVDLFCEISDFKKFENFVIKNCLKIKNLKLKIPAQKRPELNQEGIAYLSINPKYSNAHQAFVPIMTGCNNFCAYCVVPYARGREVSRPPHEIIREIKSLIKVGYKHIILLGQNVNSYKYTEKDPTLAGLRSDLKITNFSKLLRKINGISSHFWISFISSHPKDVTQEFIETVTSLKKVCEYVHLPIQAGDDKVLKYMNRKYTAKNYLALVKKIQATFEKYKPKEIYSLTTDIIVGFPGETKKQFLETAAIMNKVPYDMVYLGQYSPRPGTAAWKLKDDVSKKEKARRERFLNEILKKSAYENNRKYVGKIFEVLVESKKNGFYFGKTRTMKNVKFASKQKKLIGKFLKLEITKANIWNLEARLDSQRPLVDARRGKIIK